MSRRQDSAINFHAPVNQHPLQELTGVLGWAMDPWYKLHAFWSILCFLFVDHLPFLGLSVPIYVMGRNTEIGWDLSNNFAVLGLAFQWLRNLVIFDNLKKSIHPIPLIICICKYLNCFHSFRFLGLGQNLAPKNLRWDKCSPVAGKQGYSLF